MSYAESIRTWYPGMAGSNVALAGFTEWAWLNKHGGRGGSEQDEDAVSFSV